LRQVHSFVNSHDGAVTHYELASQWHHSRSSIVLILRALSESFSVEPPLYSKSAAAGAVQRQQQQPRRPLNQANPAFFHGAARSMSTPVGVVAPAPLYNGNRAAQSFSATSPAGANKRRVNNALRERAAAFNAQMRIDFDQLMGAQGKLSDGRRFGEASRSHADALCVATENAALLDRCAAELDVALAEARRRQLALTDGVDADADADDERFALVDNAMQAQLIDQVAADNAIGDVVYALFQALEQGGGSLSFDRWLAAVRRLHREQFRHRALALKIMSRLS
jgi:Vps23 core domain